jgi:hypothetical protein
LVGLARVSLAISTVFGGMGRLLVVEGKATVNPVVQICMRVIIRRKAEGVADYDDLCNRWWRFPEIMKGIIILIEHRVENFRHFADFKLSYLLCFRG